MQQESTEYRRKAYKKLAAYYRRQLQEIAHANCCAQEAEQAVKEAGVPFSAERLLQFCRMAMEQREYFKFTFTRSLSLCLELIADIGAGLGIDRAEMAYLEVADILAGGGALNPEYYDRPYEEERQYNRDVIEAFTSESGLILGFQRHSGRSALGWSGIMSLKRPGPGGESRKARFYFFCATYFLF